MKKLLILTLAVFWAGCSVRSIHDRSFVSDSVSGRTGHSLRPDDKDLAFELPDKISLADGLTEEEAVAVGLWNNAQLQADLAELGFARADLVDAGLLRNPLFYLLFPLGPKQLEATLNLPVEAIWQRPKRVAAAKLNVERIAENLVQHGLSLARDILTSYADLRLARERAKIVEEDAALQKEVAGIASLRLKEGDISELEESAQQLETARKADASIQARRDAQVAEEQFKTLLGIGMEGLTLELSPSPPAIEERPERSECLRVAFASRPDLRAAELAIEAAGRRVGWERSKVFNLIATLDANGEGKEGFEMGPGFQAELPILNRNQGKVTRAREELKQAARQYEAVKQTIAMEVMKALSRHSAAQQSLALSENEVLPAAETASRNAGQAYSVGAISYLELLGFKQRLIDSRLRSAEAEAELRRAEAGLKHSLGFKPLK